MTNEFGTRKDGRAYPKKGEAIKEAEKVLEDMKKMAIKEIDSKILKLRAEQAEYPFLKPQLEAEIRQLKKMRERMMD